MTTIIYFEGGDLATQREKDPTLNAIATARYNDYLANRCALSQRKVGTSNYSYIATYRPGCQPSAPAIQSKAKAEPQQQSQGSESVESVFRENA